MSDAKMFQSCWRAAQLLSFALMILILSPSALPAEEEGDLELKADLTAQAAQIRERILEQRPHFALEGRLKYVAGNSYMVNGVRFVKNNNTRVHGIMKDGVLVKVVGYVDDGKKIARIINVGNPRRNAPMRQEGHSSSSPGDFERVRQGPAPLSPDLPRSR